MSTEAKLVEIPKYDHLAWLKSTIANLDTLQDGGTVRAVVVVVEREGGGRRWLETYLPPATWRREVVGILHDAAFMQLSTINGVETDSISRQLPEPE